MKSLRREQPESVTLRIEQLHARHIGRHQARGSVKYGVIQGVDVAFWNQQRADFVQLLPVIAGFDNGNRSRNLIRAGLRCWSCVSSEAFVKLRLRSKFAVVKSSRLSLNPWLRARISQCSSILRNSAFDAGSSVSSAFALALAAYSRHSLTRSLSCSSTVGYHPTTPNHSSSHMPSRASESSSMIEINETSDMSTSLDWRCSRA